MQIFFEITVDRLTRSLVFWETAFAAEAAVKFDKITMIYLNGFLAVALWLTLDHLTAGWVFQE